MYRHIYLKASPLPPAPSVAGNCWLVDCETMPLGNPTTVGKYDKAANLQIARWDRLQEYVIVFNIPLSPVALKGPLLRGQMSDIAASRRSDISYGCFLVSH